MTPAKTPPRRKPGRPPLYATREEARAAHNRKRAEWYRRRLERDAEFRRSESERKAAWLQTEAGRESNAEATARYKAEQEARKPRPSVRRFLQVT